MKMTRLKLTLIKFCQAWGACIIAMNGGISPYHAIVAAKTGAVGAVGTIATTYIPDSYRNWRSNLAFTFGTTFVGDIIVVPTHYGPVWMEAMATGLLASTLAAMTIYTRHWFRQRRRG